jgi:hypothetical protein
MGKITIDTSEIEVFVKKGSDLILKAEAEDNLVSLMDLIDLLDTTLETIKQNIASSALKAYPDFKGIVGEKLKAVYRSYGDVYIVTDEEKADAFVRRSTTVRPNTEKIDEYKKKYKRLPSGIVENVRTPKLSITRVR